MASWCQQASGCQKALLCRQTDVFCFVHTANLQFMLERATGTGQALGLRRVLLLSFKD